jgi:hypothetical protein
MSKTNTVKKHVIQTISETFEEHVAKHLDYFLEPEKKVHALIEYMRINYGWKLSDSIYYDPVKIVLFFDRENWLAVVFYRVPTTIDDKKMTIWLKDGQTVVESEHIPIIKDAINYIRQKQLPYCFWTRDDY